MIGTVGQIFLYAGVSSTSEIIQITHKHSLRNKPQDSPNNGKIHFCRESANQFFSCQLYSETEESGNAPETHY